MGWGGGQAPPAPILTLVSCRILSQQRHQRETVELQSAPRQTQINCVATAQLSKKPGGIKALSPSSIPRHRRCCCVIGTSVAHRAELLSSSSSPVSTTSCHTDTPKQCVLRSNRDGFFRTSSNNLKCSKLEKAFVLNICMLHTSCLKGKRNCLHFSFGMNMEP